MRTFFAVSLIFPLISCTPFANPRGELTEVSTLMALSGSEPNVAAFEVAALRCGLTTKRLDGGGLTVVALIGPTAFIGDDDGRYACVAKWLANHPGKLGFMGNDVR